MLLLFDYFTDEHIHLYLYVFYIYRSIWYTYSIKCKICALIIYFRNNNFLSTENSGNDPLFFINFIGF